MNTSNNQTRIIAIFFLTIFFPTLLPINMVYAYNNGPGAFDSSTFEPVDATDMVNLLTGDMTYVLPALNVPSPEGGYPLALSYHAGIAMDQDASWVGLGWALNPGAINRNVNGYADDIMYGKERFFSFDNGGEADYNTIGIGFNKFGVNLGVAASWGSNKAFGGSVALGYGNLLTVGASTNGDFGVGVGYNGQVEDFTSIGAMGSSLRTQRYSGGVQASGTNYSIAGNYTVDNYNISERSSGINISYAFANFFYGSTKVSYGLFEDEYGDYSGMLYPFMQYPYLNSYVESNLRYSDTNKLLMYSKDTPILNVYDSDQHHKHKNQVLPSLDNYRVCAQGINGAISVPFLDEVPLRYMKGILKHYEEYQLRMARYWTTGSITLTYNEIEGHPNQIMGYFDNYENLVLNKRFNFDFTTTNSSYLRVDQSNLTLNIVPDPTKTPWWQDVFRNTSTTPSSVYDQNTMVTSDYPSGIPLKAGNRKRSGKFVESLTNEQIYSGNTNGWFIEAKNLNRDQTDIYGLSNIGAFRVTDVDGKVYHYSLPVINFETWYKNFTDENNEHSHFVEKFKDSPYATDWLLTAVTGADYVDANNNGQVDDADYGYWVEFDYGKWTDGYIWNSSSGKYDVVQEGRDNRDSFEVHRGRKQLYYLDAVRTRTHTAYFIKSLRNDALGEELAVYKEKFNGGIFNRDTYCHRYQSKSGQWGDPGTEFWTIDRKMYNLPTSDQAYNPLHGYKFSDKYLDFPRHYALKLDKIVLVKNGSLTINKAAGGNLRAERLGRIYDASSFKLNMVFIDNHSFDGVYDIDNYKVLKNINLHQSENVIDSGDISMAALSQNAEKIVDLNYDYRLMSNSPNSIGNYQGQIGGKLCLTAVNFLGKQGISAMPGYTFNYSENNASFNVNNEDGWGYHSNTPDSWSLTRITTPTGSNIKIAYESDDYSALGAKTSRIFSNGLRFSIIKNNVTNNLEFTVYRNAENGDSRYSEFSEIGNAFTLGEKMGLDMFICRRGKYGNSRREVKLDLKNVTGVITMVTNAAVSFVIPDSPAYWTMDDQDAGWILGRTFSHTSVRFPNENSDGVIMRSTRPRSCHDWRDSYDNDDVSFQYRLASSNGNISRSEKGGGLRVKSVRIGDTESPVNDKIVNYYYNKPGYTRNQGQFDYTSSGITSFAPSRDIIVVPYLSEIPPPFIMYKNVSVEQANVQGEVLSRVDYEFETLEPFQESSQSLYRLGSFLDIKIVQEETISSMSLPYYLNKDEIRSSFSNLGRLRKVQSYNGTGHLLESITNKYVEPLDNAPQIGVRQESYISKGIVWGYNPVQTNSISKIWYPNILESTTYTSGGHTKTTYYENHDFLTGEPLTTRTVSSNGRQFRSIGIPAYTRYAGMGAKVDNISNANMLSQSAAEYTQVYDTQSASWKETGVGITTWRNDWSNRAIDGTITAPNHSKLMKWRKKSQYIWNGPKDGNGIFQNYNSATDDSFDWSIGASTQAAQWLKTGEVTLYDRFSNALETKDINDNKSSVKFGDGNTKVISSANAGYNECFYSGAEYLTGSYLDQEVRMVNASRVTSYVHTGNYAVSTTSSSQLGVVLRSGEHRAGRYKISVWVYAPHGNNARLRIGSNSSTVLFTESTLAGDWMLKTAYVDVPPGEIFLYVNASSGTVIYDDFRIQPISSNLNGYVYNKWDEVTFILDNNNLGSKYEYDEDGRLVKTYIEIADDPANNIKGGFKLRDKTEYNF